MSLWTSEMTRRHHVLWEYATCCFYLVRWSSMKYSRNIDVYKLPLDGNTKECRMSRRMLILSRAQSVDFCVNHGVPTVEKWLHLPAKGPISPTHLWCWRRWLKVGVQSERWKLGAFVRPQWSILHEFGSRSCVDHSSFGTKDITVAQSFIEVLLLCFSSILFFPFIIVKFKLPCIASNYHFRIPHLYYCSVLHTWAL